MGGGSIPVAVTNIKIEGNICHYNGTQSFEDRIMAICPKVVYMKQTSNNRNSLTKLPHNVTAAEL